MAIAAANSVAQAQTQFQPLAQTQEQTQAQVQTQTRTQAQSQPQGAGSADPRIFMPYPDGDPKNPQRFRKPKFGNPPGFGAGTTGFDSTNVRANRKNPKPRTPNRCSIRPTVTLSPSATDAWAWRKRSGSKRSSSRRTRA